MTNGQLHRVLDPRELALSPGFDRDAVVYLPAASPAPAGLIARGA